MIRTEGLYVATLVLCLCSAFPVLV